jgi:hypothetical protein
MTRVLAYAVCLAGFVWLGLGSVHFRQAIRTSLADAYPRFERVVPPDHVGDAGKVLNSYYEDVYLHLPSIFWPAGMLMVGSTVLFIVRRPNKAERHCTEWRPHHADWHFGSHGGAAIGDLIVRRKYEA